MNVLLACPDVFDEIGGGQRFYQNLIRNNPTLDFYCFGRARPGAAVPSNVHFVSVTDIHRRQASDFRLDRIRKGDPAEPLKGHADELAWLLDLAASAPAVRFDIVDIADFLPLAVFFPEFLRYFGVQFDRVALSMHGTLSMGLRDNWDENSQNLASLIEHEELLYRYCDVRYGIGRQYLAGWEESCGLPAHLVDIAKVYPIEPLAARRGAARKPKGEGPPDLCFIGRQEKWKGPDLFIELCSQLPREEFGEVRIYGPPVKLHGHDSMTALNRLARHRSLEIVHEVVDAEKMAERLRHDRMVVVLPSRRDTFNLVAIEALLSGCPAVVSTACGACDFLDAAYPGFPYVKIDPDNLLAAHDEVLALLENYDSARATLAEYLASAAPRDYGMTLDQIYADEGQPDEAARAAVRTRFEALFERLAGGFLPCAERAAAAKSVERCSAVLSSYGCDTLDPAVAETEFSRAVDVIRIWQDSLAASGPAGWAAVDRTLERLSGYVFGGSRVNLYRLMAEWERARGNDLLYATYWLRVMRLSGAIPLPVFEGVQNILAANGFAEIATVAEMLYRDDEEQIYRYLDRRRHLFRSPPGEGISSAAEINRPAAPKISVIVSVYNGAGKIDTFVSGLERFTAEEKSITEFIFVDSASADDTASLLQKRLKAAEGRGIGALYMRTRERETIQRAWNRGIAAARGEYFAFLGVDEMDRPDSLAKMAAFLDRRRDIDWVQGSAVITEVSPSGSYVRDVMAYDRRFDSQHVHYFDCCYISYVGALYRKTIHDRIGFYDDGFRGAGDTEFKNRALPFIRVETLPETLGTFLNYPEARTTQSPTAELEDILAWHLHRSVGGIRYAFEERYAGDCAAQFRRALDYKKSYMDRACTDVEYAWNLAQYLRRHRPEAFGAIESFVPNLLGLRLAYERLDCPAIPESSTGAKGYEILGSTLEHVWFGIARAHAEHKLLGLPAQYAPLADNRWHQHHLVWPSTTRRKPSRDWTTAQADGKVLELAEPSLPAYAGSAPAPQAQPAVAFEIDLGRPMAGSGWHNPETDKEGNPFRWTGPKPEFVLRALLSPGAPYKCKMIMMPVRPFVADNLSVRVNDIETPYEQSRDGAAIHLSFVIPSSETEANPDFCEIVFRHEAVYSPAEHGSRDTRELGFQVRSIEFSPLPKETALDSAADQDGIAGLPEDRGRPNGPAPDAAPGFDERGGAAAAFGLTVAEAELAADSLANGC